MILLNEPIHTVSKIMIHVMASAAEAQIGVTFINRKESIPIQSTLEELGHPQPPTPICVDNSTASSFHQQHHQTKTAETHQYAFLLGPGSGPPKIFLIYWQPGNNNLGDYHTKYYPVSHDKLLRPTYLHPTTKLANTVIHHIL